MHINLLQQLGLRSKCCNARIVAWHHDKFYCESCESWLYRGAKAAKQAVIDLKVEQPSKPSVGRLITH